MRLASFDVETAGTEDEYALQPFRALSGDGWLTSAAWHSDVRGFPQEAQKSWRKEPDLQVVKRTLQWCAANDVTVATWNGAFDLAWLIVLGLRDEVFACKWIDGLLVYRHLYTRPTFMNDPRAFGLKAAVRDFIPKWDGYDDNVDFFATDPESKRRLRYYNKLDCVFTQYLTKKFLSDPRITPQHLKTIKMESACLPLIADSIVRGLCVDTEAAEKLKDMLQEQKTKAAVVLRIKNPEVTKEVLSSPKKLAELMFDKWGLRPPKTTNKGSRSTDKEALAILAGEDERVKYVHQYREGINNTTKYAEAALLSAAYNGDGCTRPVPRIYGTYTGRVTYSSSQGKGRNKRETGVAIHQWKRHPDYRRIIKAPKGYKLVEFDFAGQEYRWMAIMSGDSTMLKLCQPGEDAHTYMAAQIAGVDYRELLERVRSGDKEAKRMRQLGKVANLSLQYRTGYRRLMVMAATDYDLSLTEQEAMKIHATYKRTYPGVVAYWKRQEAKVKTGLITNMVGRRIDMTAPEEPKFEPERAMFGWKCGSTAVNFPIQSMGAEQKYLALMVMKHKMTKYDALFYLELHDGLFFIVPEDKADDFVVEGAKALSQLPYKRAFGLDFVIPFPVDAKVGDNWGDLKEVNVE